MSGTITISFEGATEAWTDMRTGQDCYNWRKIGEPVTFAVPEDGVVKVPFAVPKGIKYVRGPITTSGVTRCKVVLVPPD